MGHTSTNMELSFFFCLNALLCKTKHMWDVLSSSSRQLAAGALTAVIRQGEVGFTLRNKERRSRDRQRQCVRECVGVWMGERTRACALSMPLLLPAHKVQCIPHVLC